MSCRLAPRSCQTMWLIIQNGGRSIRNPIGDVLLFLLLLLLFLLLFLFLLLLLLLLLLSVVAVVVVVLFLFFSKMPLMCARRLTIPKPKMRASRSDCLVMERFP